MAAELVHLDARNLPIGPLVNWPNQGTLGGNFTREFDTPSVTSTAGVRGVTLDGAGDWYVGPVTPASVTGSGSRTVQAWVFNPSTVDEETVIAWGRRGGSAGTSCSLNHGSHAVWGAVTHWDSPDIGWNGAQQLGVWTCLAYTYDGSSGITSVYTNGKLSNTKSIAALNTWATSSGGGSLRFVVGAQNLADGTRSSGSSKPGAMTVAKLVVSDRAYDATELANAFNQDAAAFGKTPILAIDRFSASNSAVYAGESTILSWSVVGGSVLSIHPPASLAPGSNSLVVNPLTTTTYTLTASNGTATVSRSFTVVVDPGAPVAQDLDVDCSQGIPVAFTLPAADPNPPSGGLAWEIISQPSQGTLSGEPPQMIYTPIPGAAGLDGFTFRVSDGLQFSNTATTRIRINPPPEPPLSVALFPSKLTLPATAGSFVGYLRAVDPNFGESHGYELVPGPGDTHNHQFSIAGNQLLLQSSLAAQAGNLLSVRVRVSDSGGRNLEQILSISTAVAASSVVINEVHHDPSNNDRSEFVELHNPTSAAIAVGAWKFSRGISYAFPAGTIIPAGGYLTLAQDAVAFFNRFGMAAAGQYSGRLSGDGEMLELRDSNDLVIDQVDYRSAFPWPVSASGKGPSMELIHPSLDNDLGGSWRASTSQSSFSALTFVGAASGAWRWRPGATEASSDVSEWRLTSFVPDGSWSSPTSAPIGFGNVNGVTFNTVLSGMRYNYRSFLARRQFVINPGEVPPSLRLRYTADDGVLIWINGVLVAQRNVATASPSPSTLASAAATEGLWYDVPLDQAENFLVAGTNTIAVQVFNQSLSGDDVGFDLQLMRPASSSSGEPTPGARNSVYSEAVAPQIRQVGHTPRQPTSGQTSLVTAKVTDPQGVGSVLLHYQIVQPGGFVPAAFPRTVAEILANPDGPRPLNPAFENPANWTSVAMRDDGVLGDAIAADGIYSVVLPARAHRTLVRYRITATDAAGTSVRVPYPDDESLNFAYFVYDGVPDYVAGAASVDPAGPGKVWSRPLLNSLPIYHWIIRNEDMLSLQAYESHQQFTNNGTDAELAARRAEDWEGAFVYDGVVYDHVRTRLRGGNSRYGDYGGRFPRGKRHYKFRFNDGHLFQARDRNGKPYPTPWKALALNRMFGTTGGNGWGMPEEIGATLWRALGVPAPQTHWIHFRVIDAAAEAPDQYQGDFWGLTQAVEEYDGRYLEARGMAKGNLYKMSDWIWDAERQRRYRSADMVGDGSEFNNIRDNLHGGQSAAWLNQHVNYELWYRYSAVAEAIRHYDLFPYTDDARHALKNMAWYFEPVGSDPTRGVCMFLPYDWDASFGPSFNNGWEHANNALYGWDATTTNGMSYVDKPEMKIAHRNVLREFRDLVWQPDQIGKLLDDRAAVISAFSLADQDRWRNAPLQAGTALDDPLDSKVRDMMNFCFLTWSGTSGPAVAAGGRAAHLDAIADGPDAGLLPVTPVISYTGQPGYPLNGLSFQTTPFVDPQGSTTFAGMQWRIGRIENPLSPNHHPDEDFILEQMPVWESGTLQVFNAGVQVPLGNLSPGSSYRARVRMLDQSGRWSHWSQPHEFTAAAPDDLLDLKQFLVISEIMYHPHDVEDYEFVELLNTSDSVPLNLSEVRFTRGIDFGFGGTAFTTLAPGQRVVVVKNPSAFVARYGVGLPVAGVWGPKSLSNGGERITLSYGASAVIHDFTYDDVAPWPLPPDGDGPSLVLADPANRPDHSLAVNWRASTTRFGSPGLADSRFGLWLFARGNPAPSADWLPGMSQALGYALGADLAANPASVLPKPIVTIGNDGKQRLTLAIRTRDDGTDVSYRVEVSENLAVWNDGSHLTEQVGLPEDNGDGTHTVRYRLMAPIDQAARAYLRLKVVVEPP